MIAVPDTYAKHSLSRGEGRIDCGGRGAKSGKFREIVLSRM